MRTITETWLPFVNCFLVFFHITFDQRFYFRGERELPPEGDRLYCCTYDFVARNSSELSVLQGETLEVRIHNYNLGP